MTERERPPGRLLRLCAPALLLCSTLLAAVALIVWPKLFGATPNGVGQLVTASCGPDIEGEGSGPCPASILLVSPGRYRVEARDPAADVLTLQFQVYVESPPRALLLGSGLPPDGLSIQVFGLEAGGNWRGIEATEVKETGPGKRRLLELAPAPGSRQVRVVARRLGSWEGQPRDLWLDEVGLYASPAGLVRDLRPFLGGLPDRLVYRGVLSRLCLLLACLGTLASFGVRAPTLRFLGPAFILSLTLAVAVLELWVVYSPYWSTDIRVAVLTSGVIQEPVGANLNYGMHLGSRLLEGKGLTYGPGWVPWERMPGYGLFNALAGILAGFKSDLLSVGLTALKLHLLFLGLMNAFFAAAAGRVMRPGVAVAAAALVAFLPNQLAYTQVDSIMVPIYLLITAALCLLLARSRAGKPLTFRHYLPVHLGFALWFLMRADGLPAWAAMSLVLHWRAWRYVALPGALYLVIGISWGLYKYRYTHDFSMTTSNVGNVAWVGLWQVPNKFKWQTTDSSYFAFAKELGLAPTSEQASRATLREVLRFSATYPVYVMHLLLHRGLEYLDLFAPGKGNPISLPHVPFHFLRAPLVYALLGVITLSFCLPYEPRRTLYLAWPLLFNLPFFLFVFSDGPRHVAPALAAQLVAALPPLCEAGFYRTLLERRGRAVAVVGVLVMGWFLAHWTDEVVLASDRLRYWAPVLDPARLLSGLPR